MTVKVVLTSEDLLHYYKYTLEKRFRMPHGLACVGGILLMIIGFIGAIGVSESNEHTHSMNAFLFYALAYWGGTVAWSCSNARLRIILQNQTQKIPGLFVETRVSIDPEWLTSSSAFGEGRLRWQGIYQVVSDDRCIYIVVGDVTDIIPKSCFVSASEAQAFLGSATEYWQAARQMPLDTAGSVWPPAPRIGA